MGSSEGLRGAGDPPVGLHSHTWHSSADSWREAVGTVTTPIVEVAKPRLREIQAPPQGTSDRARAGPRPADQPRVLPSSASLWADTHPTCTVRGRAVTR